MRCFILTAALVLLPIVVASAATYVVSPDGSGDFPVIQVAIYIAVDGDSIELTDGIFRGEMNRDLDFLGKSITILSQNGNPAACIIDCQGSETDLHRGFDFHSGEDAESVLQGITIMNGLMAGC
ncbi:MAG: hypothetical protein KAY24_12340 [Candidatus Eisenbacteria sp.]|nr:hypothetical protein [Candidatus Eisenbacteria bacterium]